MANNKIFIIICIFCGVSLINLAPANAGQTESRTYQGILHKQDFFIPQYVPVVIPEHTVQIEVTQSFSSSDGSRCNVDMGVFDANGTDFNGKGFRGWSGGARREFHISTASATPGYIPGKIEAGTWNIVQMLTSGSPADIAWRLDVKITTGEDDTTPFIPVYASEKLNDTPGWYRIDTHVHTLHSDGKSTPQEIVSLGMEAGLDGIISTDHNTTSSLGHWGKVQSPSFLVVNGMEVTYAEGHWNVFGLDPKEWIDFRYHFTERERYKEAVEKAARMHAFTVANHPYSIAFLYDKSLMDGIEVWNGPWDESDEKAVQVWNNLLVAGIRKVAIGGSDYHNPKNIIGQPHMVIQSHSLSSPGILEGIAGGNAYLAKDASVTLSMSAQCMKEPDKKVTIGENLVCDSIVGIRILSNTTGTLTLYNQQGLFHTCRIEKEKSLELDLPERSQWVRAELRDPEQNMLALTNPIFIVPPMTSYPLIRFPQF